jgi:ATP-dependent DNA helicase RecQ
MDSHARKSIPGKARTRISSYLKTKDLVDQKKSLPEIAQALGFTEGTIINHIDRLIDAGEKMDLKYLYSNKNEFDEISTAFDVLGGERLKPIFEYLKGKYTYDQIRLVGVIRK